ncbi:MULTISPECIES: DUF1992 domain-containing protein [Tatumella]|uniref:Domain of uncharacterized function (DUF1992) n=2 Tax=Tatumella ptyseos TaxID=82987 RepID=A0A2X5PE81_9GAMM|nr:MULTISPECIES: DUF1992 domain-containing protein [Tatumella]KFD22390.1 putative cytoplasmic protein [Tatumella ptyseos ATCC 33301]SQK71770.1 Domain of uncharacterised function (DUF1992) [Tatumella ptyseos]
MWLIDQMAERHIQDALQKGELSGLPGEGKPLMLDDDSQVPVELRSAYRLLKNSGYLPPELESRREALELVDLLQQLDPEDHQAAEYHKRLRVLELKLRQAGLSTDFINDGQYGATVIRQLNKE